MKAAESFERKISTLLSFTYICLQILALFNGFASHNYCSVVAEGCAMCNWDAVPVVWDILLQQEGLKSFSWTRKFSKAELQLTKNAFEYSVKGVVNSLVELFKS